MIRNCSCTKKLLEQCQWFRYKSSSLGQNINLPSTLSDKSSSDLSQSQIIIEHLSALHGSNPDSIFQKANPQQQ